MYKTLKIFSFLFLSTTLWIDTPLQAVGGTKIEEVPGEEVRRKGILRIQYADNSFEIATAVLFKEGKGQLGLGARHSFERDCSKFAYLRAEKREIIKVYKPTKDVDLVLFVLSSPFKDVDEFPTLAESCPYPSVYEGYLYGYGSTTLSNYPGTLENSEGICRKGEVFMTPLSNIEPDTYFLMRGENHGHANDDLMSLSTFQKKGVIGNSLFTDELDESKEFNKLILNRGYLSLVRDDLLPESWLSPSIILPFSPSSLLGGDSGGAVISEDNQIYALASCNTPNLLVSMKVDFIQNILKETNYKPYFKLNFSGKELSIGFVPGEESILYIGLTNINSCSISQYLSLRSEILELFSEDLTNYFGRGNSLFVHTMVKIEEEEQNSSYLYKWLKMIHSYDINLFTSTVSHRNWIADTIQIAFQYIEDKKQMAITVNNAKPLNYILKNDRQKGKRF